MSIILLLQDSFMGFILITIKALGFRTSEKERKENDWLLFSEFVTNSIRYLPLCSENSKDS